MPNIPQYQSRERLINEGPQVQRSVAEAVRLGEGANMQTLAKGVSNVGESLTDIQNQIAKVDNANSKSKAEVDRTKLLYDAEEKRKGMSPQDAVADTELQTKKITEQVAKTHFKNPAFKAAYLREQEVQDAGYVIQQRAKIAKQVVSESKVLLQRDLELDKSKYRNAVTEEQKLNAVKSIHDRIYNPDLNLIFSDAEEKYKLEEDTIKQAQNDLKDQDSLRRVKEKELKVAQEAAVNARENEFIKMKVTGVDKLGGAISREDLIIMAKQDMKSGLVSPKFTDLYVNALKSPKAVKAKSIDKDFANVMYEINLGKMKPEAIRGAMLDLVSNGNLSENDFANASTYLAMVGEKNVDDLVSEGKRGVFAGIMNFAINNNSKAKESESRARMSRSYMQKLNSGVDATEAALETQREEVLVLRPEAANFPEGMLFIDNDGKKKKIMPNGDLLEEEDKPKTPSKGK